MLESMNVSGSTVFAGALALAAIFRAGVVLYRLYFHPLCCVPGPRLAGATSLYLRYYEVVEGGGITKLLPHLHKNYSMFASIHLYISVNYGRLACHSNRALPRSHQRHRSIQKVSNIYPIKIQNKAKSS